MSKHDRTKSGGFLDTLFTRSTKRSHRGGSYSSNGTRPLSANESDYNDTQEIENIILKLTIEEVNQRFNEILDDMNISKDKREPLMKKNLDEKRDMLRMHLKGKQRHSIHTLASGGRRSVLSIVLPAPPTALTQFHAQLRHQLRFLKYHEYHLIYFHSWLDRGRWWCMWNSVL